MGRWERRTSSSKLPSTPLTAVATSSRSVAAVRSREKARETEEAARLIIHGCYVQPGWFVSYLPLPGHGREAGWGGDGVEAEVTAGELQAEVFGRQRAQVAASRFVDDLAGAFLRDALADDHQARQALSSPCFRHTSVAIEQ